MFSPTVSLFLFFVCLSFGKETDPYAQRAWLFHGCLERQSLSPPRVVFNNPFHYHHRTLFSTTLFIIIIARCFQQDHFLCQQFYATRMRSTQSQSLTKTGKVGTNFTACALTEIASKGSEAQNWSNTSSVSTGCFAAQSGSDGNSVATKRAVGFFLFFLFSIPFFSNPRIGASLSLIGEWQWPH